MRLHDIAKLAFYNPLKMLGIDPSVFLLQLQDNQGCAPSSGDSAGVPLVKAYFDESSCKLVVADKGTVS